MAKIVEESNFLTAKRTQCFVVTASHEILLVQNSPVDQRETQRDSYKRKLAAAKMDEANTTDNWTNTAKNRQQATEQNKAKQNPQNTKLHVLTESNKENTLEIVRNAQREKVLKDMSQNQALESSGYKEIISLPAALHTWYERPKSKKLASLRKKISTVTDQEKDSKGKDTVKHKTNLLLHKHPSLDGSEKNSETEIRGDTNYMYL